MQQALLRQIPKVDVLLARAPLAAACAHYPYSSVKAAVQAYLSGLRAQLQSGALEALPAPEQMEAAILARLEDEGVYCLRRVVNATGVVLHTNLGRAPLGAAAAAHIAETAMGYGNLEYDLSSGRRGSRYAHVEQRLCALTGAEAAMVVNNNAGAVFLMLNTLARGKGVAISRGELVEIGGSFRVPEIMEQSGAALVEVGTTNKTHPEDYEQAITQRGASVLLKVHTSNFAMIGFAQDVALPELARLGRAHGCPVLYDAGAAFLFPPELLGLHSGDVVGKCVQGGADLVCFSGDKLFGSAQAGILVGKRAYIEQIKKNHLTRMLRIDKLSLAALDVALQHYGDPQTAIREIPILAMAALPTAQCQARAEQLLAAVREAAPQQAVSLVPVEDEIGGGSLPGVTLPGVALRVECGALPAAAAEAFLRGRPTPIIGRIHKNGILLSVRTLFPEDTEEIARALAALPAGNGGGA